VRASFGGSAAVQDNDLVSIHDRAEAVRYDDCCTVRRVKSGSVLCKIPEDMAFGFCVDALRLSSRMRIGALL